MKSSATSCCTQGVNRAAATNQIRWDKKAAAATQAAPAAPIQSTDTTEITIEPSAAPSANPAYMKEAFSDNPTAA